MKLNNKGFAISSILYSMLTMAIILILGVLFALSNRKIVFDKLKYDIEQRLNNGIPLTLATITVDPDRVQITNGVTYNVLDGVTAKEVKEGIETDITGNIMYRIYTSTGEDVTSTFTTSTIGEYIIRYDVMDSNNNMAQTKMRNLTITNIVTDHSGNNFNGTLKNGASLTGGGLTLDGVNDYVELPTLPSTINWKDGITIEFTAKWDAFLYWSRIFDFGNGANTNNIVVSNNDVTSNIRFTVYNDSTGANISAGTAYTTKKDYKIEVIKNGTNYDVKSYLNGSLVETISQADNNYMVNINRIHNYIGMSNWPATPSYFDGTIYSLKITQRLSGIKIIDFDFTK